MTGFEPATTRPPDAYSNRAELHPECECKGSDFFYNYQTITAPVCLRLIIEYGYPIISQ